MLLVAAFAAVLAMAFTSAASAGGTTSVVLNAPKSVTAYACPTDPSVLCATIDYSITNNTAATVNCSVFAEELAVSVYSGSVGAGATTNQTLTLYNVGPNTLVQHGVTLDLFVNGSLVSGQQAKVRIVS